MCTGVHSERSRSQVQLLCYARLICHCELQSFGQATSRVGKRKVVAHVGEASFADLLESKGKIQAIELLVNALSLRYA
jgi:hypothetical protein